MSTRVDISPELKFRTARSGGKGGQKVNKVETKVEAVFDLSASALLNEEQKNRLRNKLSNRINKAGELLVHSQEARTQWQNKTRAVAKMNALVNKALLVKKKRKKTKPPAGANEKRLREKKKRSQKKKDRRSTDKKTF